MKQLSIPTKLVVAVLAAAGGIASCGSPHGEPPCSYICNSDAALAIANSDASPDPDHDGYATDMGDMGPECHRTFC